MQATQFWYAYEKVMSKNFTSFKYGELLLEIRSNLKRIKFLQVP